MAIQDDNTLVTKGDLKALYGDKIAPYLGANLAIRTNNDDFYLTDEKIVGVWSDGKPLYQKLIIDTMPKVTTAGTYVTKNVVLNIDNIDLIFLKFSFVIDPNSITRPMPYTLNSGYQSKVSAAKTYLQVASAITEHSQRPFYAVIQYTKTTDTASTSLTAGAYDINFPNTWPANTEVYFGNGLYGKRFKGNLTAQSANSYFCILDPATMSPKTQNVSNIINMGGGYTATILGNPTKYSINSKGFSATGSLRTESAFFYNAPFENFGLNIRLGDGATTTTSDIYDVWVTYKK